MPEIVMYCTAFCPYCVRAEHLLNKKGVEVEKIRIDLDGEKFAEMLDRASGRRSVPQIFIGDYHVGGFDDMVELDMDGKLDSLLEIS